MPEAKAAPRPQPTPFPPPPVRRWKTVTLAMPACIYDEARWAYQFDQRQRGRGAEGTFEEYLLGCIEGALEDAVARWEDAQAPARRPRRPAAISPTAGPIV